MLGTKMLKTEFNTQKYAELANWCNNHQYKTIKDMGDYYEVVDCTPTQDEMNASKKAELLVQLKDVNTQIQELDVASMCDNGNDTTDVVVNGELVTMTGEELDDYHTNIMALRANILQQIKELK
nr:MAG TPA: hypothetical protein [Caudoviricetes sp.]